MKSLKDCMEELSPTPTKKEIVEIVWGNAEHTKLIIRISLSNIYAVDCNKLITWIEEFGEAFVLS
jgi:hypothetical protein